MSEGLGKSTQPRGFSQSEKSKARYLDWGGEDKSGKLLEDLARV